MSAELTTREYSTLIDCEAIIKRGLGTFREVGEALIQIRQDRLYRFYGHKTFEEYCQEKWQMVASRARQLVAAAETVANLESVTMVTPQSERQTRPLMALAPELQREVWQEAVETAPKAADGTPRITGVHVQSIVDRQRGIIREPIRQEGHDSEDVPARDVQDDIDPLDHSLGTPSGITLRQAIDFGRQVGPAFEQFATEPEIRKSRELSIEGDLLAVSRTVGALSNWAPEDATSLLTDYRWQHLQDIDNTWTKWMDALRATRVSGLRRVK